MSSFFPPEMIGFFFFLYIYISFLFLGCFFLGVSCFLVIYCFFFFVLLWDSFVYDFFLKAGKILYFLRLFSGYNNFL